MVDYYYDVFKDSRDSYAYYSYAIKWNVEKIAGKSRANGFIVQKIHFEINTPGIPCCEDYYEAWCVENGKCDSKGVSDDEFAGEYRNSNLYLISSIGHKDEIKYQSKVYWVDKEKESDLYEKINAWQRGNSGGVPMSNELKSIYEKDFTIFKNRTELFTRNYIHTYDCTSDEQIVDAIHHFYRKQINKGLFYWKETMEDELKDGPFEHILKLL